jgi:hypothetical protein
MEGVNKDQATQVDCGSAKLPTANKVRCGYPKDPATQVRCGYYTNKKNKKEYFVSGVATDCTNASDGRLMVEYQIDGYRCVRELQEFLEKFTRSEDQ